MRKSSIIGGVLLLVGIGICIKLVLGTAQFPDELKYGGKNYSIFSNPLEPYLKKYPERRPAKDTNSALHRGYVASWEIKDGRLFLTDVQIEVYGKEPSDEDTWTSAMSKLFPAHQMVFAEWFTGQIVIPRGELVNYVHLEYASEFSGYWIVWVKEGRVTKEWIGGLKEFKDNRLAQFEKIKKTSKYHDAFIEMKKRLSKYHTPDKEVEEDLFYNFLDDQLAMMGELLPQPEGPSLLKRSLWAERWDWSTYQLQ